MGSESKSKDKKRSSSIPSSVSGEEGRSKRQKSGEVDTKGSSKRNKKHKSEHSKSRDKHSKRHFDKDKKSKEKRKSKHSKHDRSLKSGIVELSTDDYFSKNNEFATWLKEERKLFFSDLSSESSRKLFSEFVKEWNEGKLESKHYEGIASGPRTAHKWKIKE